MERKIILSFSADAVVLYYRVNLNEPTFEFLISLPRLEYKGKYDLKVILGVVPATSAGDIIGIAGRILSLLTVAELSLRQLHA